MKARKILQQCNFKWYEIGILLFICGFMFWGMIMFSDMKITSVGSFSILQGHFRSFYDNSINSGVSPELVYYPTMYFIFALWNILPYFILGAHPELYSVRQMICLLYWDKVLVLLFCIGTLFFFYKICQCCFHDSKRSAFVTMFFLFSPYIFISELTFGTYDYLYMFFVMAALYVYLNDKSKLWWLKFTLLFGFSFTIKQLTVFIWLPLLLYREKRILHLFKHIIVGFSFYIMETLIFWPSDYFREHVLNSHFIMFMTRMTLNNGMCSISIWGILFGLILCFCFFTEYDDENPYKALWICMLGPICILLTCHWTINWILLYTPMLMILIFNSKERNKYYLTELGFCLIFILMLFYQQTNYWGYVYYGEGMLDYSILGFLRDENDILLTTKLVSSSTYTIIMGVLYSILIYYIYSLSPFRKAKTNPIDISEINEKDKNSMIANFVIGSMIYIIPILLGTISR